jgi:hypothetical protein
LDWEKYKYSPHQGFGEEGWLRKLMLRVAKEGLTGAEGRCMLERTKNSDSKRSD